MHPLYASMPATIFEIMSGLARDHDAINLGQGFPDSRGPEDVLAAAATALLEESNQYPPSAGLPVLRQAVAAHYARHQQLDLDWETEVVVTSGAAEALTAAILALVNPGDEVLLFQPLYDLYLPAVLRAGGVPRLVNLVAPDWKLDPELLDAAFTPATKLVILNNPLNPSATMFAQKELALLAERVVRNNAIVIADEVWEHIAFDGRRHVPLMTLPGMRDRVVKVGSAGKIFSLTGWKVGWMCAAPELARALARAHQFLTFTTPPNLQIAVAYGLGKDDAYFHDMRAGFQRSRDLFVAGLGQAGYAARPSAGTYFLTVDLAASGIHADDVTFCDRLVRDAGVAAVPLSAFYAENAERSLVRLCFAKQDATLRNALHRLEIGRKLFA